MRLSSAHLQSTFLWIAAFAAFALNGCGDSCFAGAINSSGGESNESVCWGNSGNGTVNANALKSPMCIGCSSSSGVEHVFVTLRGMQLHANTMNVPSDADWVELAPQLANLPRQIDLMESAPPVVLIENAHVPAGYYHEIKLQVLDESSANAEGLPGENPCGNTGWNCIVYANGTVEALRFSGNAREVLIPLESLHSNSMAVLANMQTELQLQLGVRPEFLFSGTGGWKVQNVLAGSATVAEPQSLVVGKSPTD